MQLAIAEPYVSSGNGTHRCENRVTLYEMFCISTLVLQVTINQTYFFILLLRKCIQIKYEQPELVCHSEGNVFTRILRTCKTGE